MALTTLQTKNLGNVATFEVHPSVGFTNSNNTRKIRGRTTGNGKYNVKIPIIMKIKQE